MKWVFHDGGRAAAGYKGATGDCATRSIAIATGRPYKEVYDAINAIAKAEGSIRNRPYSISGKRSDARTGVHTQTVHKYMESIGWKWHPTMTVGSGCKVHLREGELPSGPLVARVSRHFTAVVDGVIYDNHDPSREGRRCVYGYWSEK